MAIIVEELGKLDPVNLPKIQDAVYTWSDRLFYWWVFDLGLQSICVENCQPLVENLGQ